MHGANTLKLAFPGPRSLLLDSVYLQARADAMARAHSKRNREFWQFNLLYLNTSKRAVCLSTSSPLKSFVTRLQRLLEHMQQIAQH